MISREFRAFRSPNSIIFPIATRAVETVKILSDHEKTFILEMEKIYRKLEFDEFYLEGLEMMENKIQSLKIELSTVMNSKNELCRMCNQLLRAPIQPNERGLRDSERISYFTERHEDCSIRCRVLNEKLKSFRCRMVGMCFWPLIATMKKIMLLHGRQCVTSSCDLKTSDAYILSKVLLLILQNSDLTVFPTMTQCVSRWTEANICAHPIIKMMEEKIDERMYWQRNMTTQTPYDLAMSISSLVFESYEVLYLEWVVINMMSSYLKWNHRFPMNLKIVFSINGIGMMIYGFLLTDDRALSLLTKLNVVKKRKRVTES